MTNDPVKTNNPGPPYLGVNMNETQMATHTNWKVITDSEPHVGQRVRLKWMPSGIIHIGRRKEKHFSFETVVADPYEESKKRVMRNDRISIV